MTILSIDFAGCLLSLAVIISSQGSASILWLGTVLLGISQASIFATFMNLAGERIHITGTVAGLFLVGAGGGGMLLPWLIGQVFVKVGPGAMMELIFFDTLLNLLMLSLFTRVAAKPRIAPEASATAD
jgi:fucose permease